MTLRIQKTVFRIWHIFFTLLFILVVVPLLWILTRLGVRRLSSEPLIVFGSTPIITIKYYSLALQRLGIDSITVARGWYSNIHQRKDFDVVFGAVDASFPLWHRLYILLFEDYFIFTRLLWERNVFFYYFDGFYFHHSGKMRCFEIPALKFLGKKVIVMNYGSDIIVPSATHDVLSKYVTLHQYPDMLLNECNTRQQIKHFTRLADAIIACGALGADHLSRIDFICASHLCIDETKWIPNYGPPRAVGEPMRVLHAPNHRLIKGTKFLIQAIDQLKKEGLNIELVLLENLQNEEVRRQIALCHVVAEQFIMGWHGLNAIEGMVSGKPVLCFLREDLRKLYTLFSFAGDCPIVNTPVEMVEDNLRKLYYHPELCEELGRLGRTYVENYHSLEAMGGFLKGVIGQVLSGEKFDAEAYWEKRKAVGAVSSTTDRTTKC
jgi:glycosyltransferase involved in cell wall biosynthesis